MPKTKMPAATATMFELIELTRSLIDSRDRKGFSSEETLKQQRSLLARAEVVAGDMPIGDAHYVVNINDSGTNIMAFDNEEDRKDFLERQDETGDDFYTLSVAPDRSVEISLAEVGVPA